MEDKKKQIEFRKEYNSEDSGLAFLLGNVLPLLCVFVLTFILSSSNINVEQVSGEIWFLILSALTSQLAFVVTVIFVNKINKVKFEALKFSFKLGCKNILLCVLVGIVCYFGLYNFIGIFDALFSKIGYVYSGQSLPLTNGWELILNIVLLGIIPPICEELVFRGIVFNGLRKRYSDALSVILSAGLFALMHGSLAQLVYPFLMGMLFSVLVLRTGNLLSSIVVHATNNIMVIVFSYIQNITGFSFAFSLSWWEILLSIFVAFVAVVILFIIDKIIFKHKTNEVQKIKEKESGHNKNYLMVIGIVIAIIVFIINTVSSF